jgi:iron complex outermembrane receptor protein
LNLTGRYVSKYNAVSSFYAANINGDNYPGDFIVLNTGIKYQADKTTTLSLLCRNIGNVQYEEAEWFRAPGRSYVAGIDFTF